MSRKPIEYIFIERFEPDEEAMRESLELAIRQTAENRAKKQREQEKLRSAENSEK